MKIPVIYAVCCDTPHYLERELRKGNDIALSRSSFSTAQTCQIDFSVCLKGKYLDIPAVIDPICINVEGDSDGVGMVDRELSFDTWTFTPYAHETGDVRVRANLIAHT